MQQLITIMKDPNNLFCSSNFPLARERISLKFVENLGTRLKMGSPDLV
jgi:hypothetical protein